MKTVILYLTHKISDQIINEFEKIKSTGIDTIMLYNGEKENLIPTPNLCFTNDEIWNLNYPRISDEMIDHAHFPVLYYYQSGEVKYDYYWVVEYDVRFTGEWLRFFEKFEENDADFITSHIRYHHEEPGWLGWKEMNHPNKRNELGEYLRSFNPIYRISNRTLEYIDNKLRAGYSGLYEVLFPTLIYHSDKLKMIDFGGNGKFVEGPVNGNYISRSDKDGEIFGGTFRYRPTMRKAGIRKNKLYHPIKADSEKNYIGLLKFVDKYLKSFINNKIN